MEKNENKKAKNFSTFIKVYLVFVGAPFLMMKNVTNKEHMKSLIEMRKRIIERYKNKNL